MIVVRFTGLLSYTPKGLLKPVVRLELKVGYFPESRLDDAQVIRGFYVKEGVVVDHLKSVDHRPQLAQ